MLKMILTYPDAKCTNFKLVYLQWKALYLWVYSANKFRMGDNISISSVLDCLWLEINFKWLSFGT